jgi:hypothetical protein
MDPQAEPVNRGVNHGVTPLCTILRRRGSWCLLSNTQPLTLGISDDRSRCPFVRILEGAFVPHQPLPEKKEKHGSKADDQGDI